MANLYKCPACHAEPIRETKTVMLGKIREGGYPIAIGRYHCPQCGFGPSWGQSYSVSYPDGWEKAVAVWNKKVESIETVKEGAND